MDEEAEVLARVLDRERGSGIAEAREEAGEGFDLEARVSEGGAQICGHARAAERVEPRPPPLDLRR